MFNKKNDVNILIEELYKYYELLESYIWDNPNKNLSINIINENNTFSMYLNNKDDDAFIINFSNKEKELYMYISASLMVKIFEHVEIHTKNNTIYNNVHKNYVNFVVNDESLMNKHKEIINSINNNQSTKAYNSLDKIYLSIPKKYRKIDNDAITTIDYRNKITKALIREGKYE